MRPSLRRRILGVTASLVIAALSPAIAQEQSHTAKGSETRAIFRVLTGRGSSGGVLVLERRRGEWAKMSDEPLARERKRPF
jgi:hypothetical protein